MSKQPDCKRFRDYLRPHDPQERKTLEALLLADGCRDPLIVGVLNGKRYLIDGFHRKDICDRNNIEYRFEEKEFDSEDALHQWMEDNANGRRNMYDAERKYYVGKRFETEKQSLGGQIPGSKNKKGTRTSGTLSDSTAKKIGKEISRSHFYVEQAGKWYHLIEEACRYGLAFLKWPLFTGRLRLTAAQLRHLIELGAGGCQAEIEELLQQEADDPQSKKGYVSGKDVFKRLGLEPEEAPEANHEQNEPIFGRIMQAVDEYVSLAKKPEQLAELVTGLRAMADTYARQLKEMQS